MSCELTTVQMPDGEAGVPEEMASTHALRKKKTACLRNSCQASVFTELEAVRSWSGRR